MIFSPADFDFAQRHIMLAAQKHRQSKQTTDKYGISRRQVNWITRAISNTTWSNYLSK